MISNLLVLSTLYIIMALMEGPGLLKKQQWRELIAFSFFWFIALILSILLVIGVKIPSYEELLLKLFNYS